MTLDLLPTPKDVQDHMTAEPTRAAGLARMHAFLPLCGRRYAEQRNFDFGPEDRSNVSLLSPWIRHRLVLEEEVVRAVLLRFAFSTAEKFIQEVVWRTYWKGWLQMRPQVWEHYRFAVATHVEALEQDEDLHRRWMQATTGGTGIACFDAWVRELVTRGYLHNHARMWFASIWIFTLRLPWELGADFFFRHLLDGDPASNTLSWRWVAGLQTVGKTYLARPTNIAKFTGGRFADVTGLATTAPPLNEEPAGAPRPLTTADQLPETGPVGLLVTEDDCGPLSLDMSPERIRAAAGLTMTHCRSPLPAGDRAAGFSVGAVQDALTALARDSNVPVAMLPGGDDIEKAVAWARSLDVKHIVTAEAPAGPTAEWLSGLSQALSDAGIGLVRVRRPWDNALWPHAVKGFFTFKEKVPATLRALAIGP